MKKKICNTEEIFDKVMGLEKEPPARQEVLKELAEIDKNFKKYGLKPKMIKQNLNELYGGD